MIVGFTGGFDYLLRLSTIAVAFVGWSAIVVTLRRALGAELSALHMYFVRFFIEGGLAVAAFGLLPAALSLTQLTDTSIWRLSSASAALMFSAYFVFLFRRRRRVTPGRLQLRTIVAFILSVSAASALWVNAVAPGFEPSSAVYVLALSTLLVVGGWVFVQNLELFFNYAAEEDEPPRASSPMPTKRSRPTRSLKMEAAGIERAQGFRERLRGRLAHPSCERQRP